jgi:hypothetical protein
MRWDDVFVNKLLHLSTLFLCVLDWIEAVIFDMATNIETSFSSLVHEIVLKTLKLTESSCFWTVTSFCVPFKHYYNPFLVSGMFTNDGQLYLLLLFFFFLVPILMNQRLRFMSLKFESFVTFKKSILLWNRPWQNSLRCNWMIALPYLTRCIPGWNGPYPSRLAPVPLYRIAGVEVKLGFFCFFGEFGFVYIMNKLYVAANALVYLPICTKGYSHASKDCTFLEGGREWVSNVTINYILLSNSKDSSISLSLHLSMLFRAFFF